MRVYEIARELELSSKEALALLRELGIEVKSHSSSIDDEQADRLRARAAGEAPPEPEEGTAEEAPAGGEKEEAATPEPEAQPILTVKFPITVKQMCELTGVKPNILIKKLLDNGIFASLNQFLDEETATVIAADCGYELVSAAAVEAAKAEKAATAPPKPARPAPPPAPDLKPRGPVVTLMGHIDHGKTSILDAVRRSRITAKEAGGITQHIGAYRVEVKGQGVVFLDTPGHAAFTTMRSRGANLTDIVVLVVAADDGIMPQTLEAIDHAQAAGVPVVVAINKCDKSAADPMRVKSQLMEKGLKPEDLGGDVICVECSATTKAGLDALLEMLLLQAEIMELKASPSSPAEGVVVEAKLTGNRGPVATLLVRNGTLRRGQAVICGDCAGKIKAMFDDQGKSVKEAPPATPVEVLGIVGVPEAGSAFRVLEDESEARRLSERIQQEQRQAAIEEQKKTTLEDFFQKLSEGETQEMRIVLKGDVQGSVEALSTLLEDLSTDDVNLNIIRSGVGDLSESDVMLAAASDAIIIGFHVSADARVRQAAKREGVDYRLYNIIYEAVDEVRQGLEGLLEPVIEEKVLGQAVVQEVFKISKVGRIAGCRVESGKLRRKDRVRIRRGDEELGMDTIVNLKRFKDEAAEVVSGQECGIGLGNFQDFEPGDIIEAIELVKTARKL